MAAWLFAIVSLVVLVLLGSVEQFIIGEGLSAWLSVAWLAPLLSVALVVSLLLWLFTPVVSRHRAYILSLQMVSFVAIVALFVIKSLYAYHQLERQTPQSRTLINATATIYQISDSVYDKVLATPFRQVAVLSNIEPLNPKQNSRLIHNPFANDDDFAAGQAVDLQSFEGMTVLLTADPKFAKSDLQALESAQPASILQVQLLLEPIKDGALASGFDNKAWLRTRQVQATAQILAATHIGTAQADTWAQQFRLQLERLRWQLRQHFYKNWHTLDGKQAQARAVTLSLLTGDRALIDRDTKDLYQLAGISHLLAISGTHVLFLAIVLAAMITAITDRFALLIYQKIPRWQIRMAIMVAAALIYAVFTGFEVPAVRTVYMLMAAWLIRYFALPTSIISALFVVALLMVWADPYVLWQAGFWLSFVAVVLLIRYENSHVQAADLHIYGWLGRLWQKLSATVSLQLWLFLTMLPVSILLFGKVSLWGLLVNLFAIGLFGFVVVPINLLAGVVFWVSPWLADLLWSISVAILYGLHQSLSVTLTTKLPAVSAWLYAPFGMAGFVLAFLLVIWLILPKVLPRFLLLLPIMALIFLTKPVKNPRLEIVSLPSDTPNVSQLLLTQYGKDGTSHWLILNDLGVKSLRKNHAQILTDQLYRRGVAAMGLDGVIVQTPSDIFIPMVGQLADNLPISRYWQAGNHQQLVSIRQQSCRAGMAWQQEGFVIRALTGWSEINDERVQYCAIEVLSDYPFSWQGNAAQTTEADAVDDWADDDSQPSDSKPSTKAKSQLVISTSAEPLLWQLWQSLCVSNNRLDVLAKEGYYPVWLTSWRADEATVAKQRLSPAKIYMLDE
ncbi:competence protein ComEC [Moraxella cuniculi DSM 21768]|uniref:Competence protein ComEC n=1 Tax=Moraxella cuniculi DSM 21768 TaxID=1122245 RepID=A0A1N7DD30_9GAMM|nr:ComEC/Rec2 family competence protein [Moraxella cuniculi]OOS07985.1 competence protein ComEC [Moraxella cuniculi]SIR73708.1 competence protein ComEC [Moraxella cuniculi DSM 21768]